MKSLGILATLIVGVVPLVAQDFKNLHLLCSALSSRGVPTRGWAFHDVEYFCISTYKDIGPTGACGLKLSNIAYYVNGQTATQADAVKIVANQNVASAASAKAIRTEMLLAAQSWFKAVSVVMPPVLTEAITAGTSFSGRTPAATVIQTIEQSGRMTTTTIAVVPRR